MQIQTMPSTPRILAAGFARLEGDLARLAPELAQKALGWMRRTSLNGDPAADFADARSFPSVRLPLWLERSSRDGIEERVHLDLAASSMSAHYFFRLKDGLSDPRASIGQELAPLLGVFAERFQSTYRALLPAEHPFHERLTRAWAESSEARASALPEAPTLEDFKALASRRLAFARLPLEVVAERLGRHDALESWLRFVDLLSSWHALEEDLLEAHADVARGARTYVLLRAAQRGRSGDAALGWLLDEGFEEILAALGGLMTELDAAADALGTEEPRLYLAAREEELQHRVAVLRAGLADKARLDAALARGASL